MNSGFYKNDDGNLLYGPNFVLNKDYELHRDKKDEYSYPIDGWCWFESENDARVYFNMNAQEDNLTDNSNEFI